MTRSDVVGTIHIMFLSIKELKGNNYKVFILFLGSYIGKGCISGRRLYALQYVTKVLYLSLYLVLKTDLLQCAC